MVIDFNSRDKRKMNWLQIVILILNLLKQAKSANSQQEFVSAAQAAGSPFAANGAILKFIWEHREEIMAFFMSLFASSTTFRAPSTPGASSMVDSSGSEEAEVLALLEELKS